VPAINTDVDRLERALSDLWRRGTVGRLHASLSEAAGVDVDRSGYLVLRRIGTEAPVRVTDLAGVFGVEPSTISRHVRTLTDRGWVRRIGDPSDGRATLLEPTDAGTDVIDRIERERLRTLAEVLDAWDADDRAAFAGLMERFAENLAEHLDPSD
jgi:DNA-binding MarR family transcriptional regulator